MMPAVVTLLFVALAAVFNAVMDATENENFFESVFRNLPQRFWYKRESWKYAKKIFKYRFDAWHIAKTIWVLCVAGALVSAIFFGVWLAANPSFWFLLATVSAIGLVWNAVFNLFYHIILKIK